MKNTLYNTLGFDTHNCRAGPGRGSRPDKTFFDMSKKNSEKKLLGVYRRCLSSLNCRFTRRFPETESDFKAIAKQAVEDAFKFEEKQKEKGCKAFSDEVSKKRWIAERSRFLYERRMVRSFNDPLRTAKEHIQTLADSVSSL